MPEGDSHGVLHWALTDMGRRLKIVDADGKVRPVPKPDKVLDPELAALPEDDLEGVAVDFYWSSGGQAKRVRRRGTPWTPPTEKGAAPRPGGSTRDETIAGRGHDERGPAGEVRSASVDEFSNPYSFIPAPPRLRADPELGDHLPAGHDRLHDHLWTGRLTLRLEVATPLLLLDSAAAQPYGGDGHKRYPPALVDDQPYLAPTAVKGMLRSSYEAVTNSRFGVFTGHDRRLALRAPANDGLRAIPARVEGDNLVLLPGTTPIGMQGTGPGVALHAAWLPRWREPRLDLGDLKHGDEVRAWVELVHHHGRNRSRQLQHNFDLWQVTQFAPASSQLAARPTLLPQRPPREHGSWYEPTGRTMCIEAGWLSATNQSFSRKHDERIFFASPDAPERRFPITPELRDTWSDVIDSYRAAHTHDELWDRRDKDEKPVSPSTFIGQEPGKTAWSVHLYEDGFEYLHDGMLVHVTLDPSGRHVEHLSPVMIGRRPYPVRPADLLDASLRPAASLAELSPADRVFGWVARNAKGAYRGQLRIGPVTVVEARIEPFDPPLPLAILGQPKAQQARFYTARDSLGAPLDTATPKSAMYRRGQGIRGRKAYPHHAGLPERYWEPRPSNKAEPIADPTQELLGDRYREYLRPRKATDERAPQVTKDGRAFVTTSDQLDSQNRSIDGWVAPGSVFTFEIDVTNLSGVELGALLWLCSRGPSHHHRLGLGKPLGFGSLVMSVVQADVAPGTIWRSRWSQESPPPDMPDPWQAVEQYKAAVAGPGAFEEVSYIRAFLANAHGTADIPVHYPRVRVFGMSKAAPAPPDPRGHGFDWFVLNERMDRGRIVEGRSLPATGQAPLLTYDSPEPRR